MSDTALGYIAHGNASLSLDGLSCPQICQNEKDGDILAQKVEMKLADEEDFGNGVWGKRRSWVWNTMEYPWTSKTARSTGTQRLWAILLNSAKAKLAFSRLRWPIILIFFFVCRSRL